MLIYLNHYFEHPYQGYYYIDDLTNHEQIQNDMQRIRGEEQIILYVNHNIENINMNSEKILYTDEEWDVYLIENK